MPIRHYSSRLLLMVFFKNECSSSMFSAIRFALLLHLVCTIESPKGAGMYVVATLGVRMGAIS